MFSSNYSIAIELLRRYLAKKGNVSIDSFSDSHTCFVSDGNPVVLSLNDASADAANVTIKFGKDPHSHSVTIDMYLYNLHFPTESISTTVERDFSKQIDTVLLNTPEFNVSHISRRKSLQDLEKERRHIIPESGMSESFPSRSRKSSGQYNKPPDMPDFEDEYEVKGKQRFQPPSYDPTIGDADLNPAGLGGYPDLQPFLDPLAANPHGGMYPDRDHPMFGGGVGGSGTGLPPPGVPPGARYDDPYGEENSLGAHGPSGFGGLGGRGGRSGRGGRGGPGSFGGFGGPDGSGLGGGYDGGFGGGYGPPGF